VTQERKITPGRGADLHRGQPSSQCRDGRIHSAVPPWADGERLLPVRWHHRRGKMIELQGNKRPRAKRSDYFRMSYLVGREMEMV
jgi:hypothetical protein